MNTLIQVGPVMLLIGLVVSAWYYLARPHSEGAFTSYAFRIVLAGIGGLAVGTVLGIGAFCAPADAGNLCGLGGVLGLGPFVSGLAMAFYARRLAR